ncbi:MAG: tRNA (adenosine(37)-N6)-dimethylallyltransferase MiaA [Planctomycetaceae bacterium]|nr:tRNA (adenosine(37)-N6)-dimethylallyltransferase MiaA [Planctomycetaceae bacterium]
MSLSVQALRQCWFLAGPTAVGKSATSLELAKRLNAEIVSMDSMAIYRGMDIGTAKPSAAEQALAPHHLIDVVSPHEEFSVADYVDQCRVVVAEILGRGRTPLFVGGTGLYLRSLLRGVFSGPEADWPLREELERQREANGNEWLHGQLAAVDKVTATRLHPNDTRRVIRAIEVYRVTGQPLSKLHGESARSPDDQPACAVWLEPPREWLHQRINRRVDLMMDEGLLEETQRLLSADPAPARTARQALGYREVIDHLEGRRSLKDAVEQIKTGTRQFAKRQHTWFRGLSECRSVKLDGSETTDLRAERILAGAKL